jgi:hypothetical protein
MNLPHALLQEHKFKYVPKTLVFGTAGKVLALCCHKPCSKPKQLLKVFASPLVVAIRGVAEFR